MVKGQVHNTLGSNRVVMLCPDRDTLLNMSTRNLWVQGFSGSMVQWFRQGLDNQVETEDERNQWIARVRQRQSWDLLQVLRQYL